MLLVDYANVAPQIERLKHLFERISCSIVTTTQMNKISFSFTAIDMI
jgi:hypothetical protein